MTVDIPVSRVLDNAHRSKIEKRAAPDVPRLFTLKCYLVFMPRLRDSTALETSIDATEERLDRFLTGLRERDGVSRVRLRVPIDGSTLGISIDREVNVEVRKGRDASRLNDVLQISWVPTAPIVFPSFEGTLATWGDAAKSYVELDGSYTPPFGEAGQLFDATVGHQIAQATARAFLKDLKRAVEAMP